MAHLVDRLIAFGRVLRGRGLDVHVGRLLDVIEALPHVNVASRDDVYCTCRALLVHRHEDLATFDAAARETNVTLLGFVRGGACNIYSGAHRIQV